MSDRRQDFELLQRFTLHGEQSAFADLVRRHLDLVFATALRKVEDSGVAQEIAQNVFAVLARKAWQFAPDDSLAAWLHKAALLESKSWLRGELGRRRRERTAAELRTTMHTPDETSAFQALVPLLDEALLSLREKDRTALLLRFYESQSLREVGAAFGVSEDAAQKRVQSALQKLTEFFKDHGFRTASVAAAATALQSTATSGSASLMSAVVGAALQAAPSAVGLGVLLAPLASLSRVKTGALCAALVALPIAWQLKERHDAGDVAKRIQAQLLDARTQFAGAQSELERLRGGSQTLEQALLQANEAARRAAETAKAFEVWKNGVRTQLVAEDYRWSDESLFARIPKSALPELGAVGRSGEPFCVSSVISPSARELLGLTPREREVVEETLHRHFTDVNAAMAARMSETNKPLEGRQVAGRVFALPEFDDEFEDDKREREERTLAELRELLGDERWAQMQARENAYSEIGLKGALLRRQDGTSSLSVWVDIDESGTPTMGFTTVGNPAAYGSEPLSMFLPEGDPDRTDGAENFGKGLLSEAFRQRAIPWLQQQAIARLRKNAKP